MTPPQQNVSQQVAQQQAVNLVAPANQQQPVMNQQVPSANQQQPVVSQQMAPANQQVNVAPHTQQMAQSSQQQQAANQQQAPPSEQAPPTEKEEEDGYVLVKMCQTFPKVIACHP